MNYRIRVAVCLALAALVSILLFTNLQKDESRREERTALREMDADPLTETVPERVLPVVTDLTDGSREAVVDEGPVSRGANNLLMLSDPREVVRRVVAGRVFEDDVLRVRAVPASGPLTMNDHTVSAVEAAYDPDMVKGFLASDAESIRFPLDARREAVLRVDRILSRGPRTHTLIGAVEGEPNSDSVLVFHDGVVSGSIALREKNEHYQFASAGNGDVAIRLLDPESFPDMCGQGSGRMSDVAAFPTTPEEILRLGSKYGDVSSKGASSETESLSAVTMDTVIGYGRQARIAEGGVAAMEALIMSGVDRMNMAFGFSLITDTEVVLLATVEDPYYEFPGMITGHMAEADEVGTLDNPVDQVFDTITALRDLLGADHSGVIVKDWDGAGGYSITGGRSMVVARNYITSTTLVFAHEFGHSIGCRHAWGDTPADGDLDRDHHRYGWRLDPPGSDAVRSVMAYNPQWGNGVVIPYYSNPSVQYNGANTGAVDGYDATGDPTADPRSVSGGLIESAGPGYNGNYPNLGARNADFIQANAPFLADNADRTVPEAGPEISVMNRPGIDLVDGAVTINCGQTSPDGFLERRFLILNRGSETLSGIDISFDGANPDDFTIVETPSASLPSLYLTTLTVRFQPTGVGAREATMHIVSNDADEGSFDIMLEGQGVNNLTSFFDDFDPGIDSSLWQSFGADVSANTHASPPGPQTTGKSLWFGGWGVRTATTLPMDTSGGGDISFIVAGGTQEVQGGSFWDFSESVKNLLLEYSNDGVDYVVFGGPFRYPTWTEIAVPIPAAAMTPSTQFRFRQTSHGGAMYDHYAIDDLLIDLVDTSFPEIEVEQPSGVGLTDGSSTTDFGSVLPGGSEEVTYTIRNGGTENLTGLAVSLSGTDVSDFGKTDPMAATLAPGESTTFTVTFQPDSPGDRTATLHIASNDSDENPFDIGLSGNASFDDFHGNDPESATTLILDGSGTGMDTGFLQEGDEDWFSFSLSGSFHVVIHTSGNVDTLGWLEGDVLGMLNDVDSDDDAGMDGNFRIELALGPGDYLLRVTSRGEDVNGSYDLRIERGAPATLQPDNRIGGAGNGSYGVQDAYFVSKKAKPVRTVVSVENDGEVSDIYTVRGSSGNRLFKTSYGSTGGNVTAQIVAGSYETGRMDPGDPARSISILVRPKRSKLKKAFVRRGKRKVKYLKKKFTTSVTSTSQTDGTASDVTIIHVRTK